MTAVELGKSIKEGKLSVAEVVSAFLRRMDMVEKDVRGFVTIDREGALLRAKEIQKLIDEGKLKGPLAGVPVAVKDNLCTKGLRTTCGSKIL